MPNTMPMSLVLAALLSHLRRTGWPYVDLDKLTQVYETYQNKTASLIYGNHFNRTRQLIRQELDGDLKDLEMRRIIQRTVSRVQLTGPGAASAAKIPMPASFAKLIETADEIFIPKVKP